MKSKIRISRVGLYFAVEYLAFVFSCSALGHTPFVNILARHVWIGSLATLGFPAIIFALPYELIPHNYLAFMCLWISLGAIQVYLVGLFLEKILKPKNYFKFSVVVMAGFFSLASASMLSGIASRDVYFFKPTDRKLTHYADIIKLGFYESVSSGIPSVKRLFLAFPHSRTAALSYGEEPSKNPRSLSMDFSITVDESDEPYFYNLRRLSILDGTDRIALVLPEAYMKAYQIRNGVVSSIKEESFVFNPRKEQYMLMPQLIVLFEMPNLPRRPKKLELEYEVEIKTPSGEQGVIKGKRDLDLVRYVLPFYDNVK